MKEGGKVIVEWSEVTSEMERLACSRTDLTSRAVETVLSQSRSKLWWISAVRDTMLLLLLLQDGYAPWETRYNHVDVTRLWGQR